MIGVRKTKTVGSDFSVGGGGDPETLPATPNRFPAFILQGIVLQCAAYFVGLLGLHEKAATLLLGGRC